jgi:hypothetical protein
MTASFIIPGRIRLAITKALEPHPPLGGMLDHLRMQYGFHDLDGLPEAMATTGEATALEMRKRITYARAGLPLDDTADLASGRPSEDVLGKLALLAVPDSAFVSAVDYGLDVYTGYCFDYGMSTEPAQALRHRIGVLLARNGLPYAFDGNGRLSPTGSQTMGDATLRRAYDVLDDPRLADARTHLAEAVQRLNEPDEPEAVDEARMAVEAGLLAVLDAHGLQRPAKRQPQDLFNALEAAGVLTRDAEELILATPRFRGRTAARARWRSADFLR